MRKAIYILAAMIAIGVSVVSFAAQPKEMTVKGEVVDLACYEGKNGARGAAHKSCGVTCAKGGNQLAIVDGSNRVYLISGDYTANKNEKLIDFVADMVEAKGDVTEKDGKNWLMVKVIKRAEAK
jgi:hypothetical protein